MQKIKYTIKEQKTLQREQDTIKKKKKKRKKRKEKKRKEKCISIVICISINICKRIPPITILQVLGILYPRPSASGLPVTQQKLYRGKKKFCANE